MNRPPGRPGERGSGTVLVLAVALVVGLLAVATVLVGQATLLRHRADAAADLGALAAASAIETGGDGCATATMVVTENGGAVVGCSGPQSAGDVEVRVHLTGVLLGGLVLTATGTARAGPAATP